MGDETDHHPTDTMAPWTIKSVATSTRETVTAAARKEGMTVGQWLERQVREWTEAGSPTRVAHGPTAMADVAQAMQAARAIADAAGVPLPGSLAREAFATVKLAMRQARGLAPAHPRIGGRSLPRSETQADGEG
jgi:hypothetical protein